MKYYYQLKYTEEKEMTEIIIIGDEKDHALERLIKSSLSMTYKIIYVKENEFYASGSGYEIICFDCACPKLHGTENAVVIAKRSAAITVPLPGDCTAIINADNSMQPEAIERCGVAAVECGLSHTSTISFSSENDETAVISLNRSIKALSGKEIQPLEIPVKKNGADIYTLMSFTALRLLLDDFESDLGELI